MHHAPQFNPADLRMAEAIINDAIEHIDPDMGATLFDSLLGLAIARALAKRAGVDLQQELAAARSVALCD